LNRSVPKDPDLKLQWGTVHNGLLFAMILPSRSTGGGTNGKKDMAGYKRAPLDGQTLANLLPTVGDGVFRLHYSNVW